MKAVNMVLSKFNKSELKKDFLHLKKLDEVGTCKIHEIVNINKAYNIIWKDNFRKRRKQILCYSTIESSYVTTRR